LSKNPGDEYLMLGPL